MKLQGLRQPPHNTTLMGVMRGAIDYYAIPCTDAFLYGASGMAFVANIHNQLCPSGPYCWNSRPVLDLLGNVGLDVSDLGFFWNESPADQRAAVEKGLKERLDAGTPCSLMNMENQLITGYDEAGFLTAQPWDGMDFPPAHLSFGSWSELGDEVHISFFGLGRKEPIDRKAAVAQSLGYAVDLYRNPAGHTQSPYAIGGAAYDNWREAVQNGHGGGHGNWWNATVYAECRSRASAYFREVAPLMPSAEDAEMLAQAYAELAGLLSRCADKGLPADDKIGLLNEAASVEERCVEQIAAVLPRLG